ncbi:MAG: sigma-70 family RNA polymerase sigma factor [Candidatus Sumerlaeaceae bacterium]|nr:sigma-70 family RNA polymerase sigma factor [Candidatus Sumerlaeaceae bacterium]
MYKPLPPGDEEKLVKAAQGGSGVAFEALVRHYCGMVFAVAFARLKNREAAEDLVQDVFLRVFLNLDKLAQPKYFGTWLGRITRNLAMDWARRDQRRSALVSMVPLEEAPARTDEIEERKERDKVEEREREETANAAIMSLPDDQREILLLHFSEGMTLVDIAKMQGVHPTTVGRQLNQALAKVRREALEPAVLDTSRTLKAHSQLATRTVALTCAAAAMTGEAKAALLTEAQVEAAAALAQTAGALSTKAGMLGQFAQYIAGITGGALTVGKGLAILGTASAIAGAGWIATNGQPGATTGSTALVSPGVAQVAGATAGRQPWPIGTWMGPVRFPGAKKDIRIVYIVRWLPDGKLKVQAQSPDQGFGILESEIIDIFGGKFHVKLPTVDAEFIGQQSGEDKITGTLKQKGAEVPVVLTYVEEKPQGKPGAPFPKSDAGTLQQFVGTFASHPQVSITIKQDDQGLIVAAPQMADTRLVQESEYEFRLADGNTVATFGRGDTGKVDRVIFRMQIGDSVFEHRERRIK